MSQQAWRCRTCGKRFYAAAPAGAAPVEPVAQSERKHHKSKSKSSKKHGFRMSSQTRRRMIEALIFLGMLAVFYAFLLYVTQERSGGSE